MKRFPRRVNKSVTKAWRRAEWRACFYASSVQMSGKDKEMTDGRMDDDDRQMIDRWVQGTETTL